MLSQTELNRLIATCLDAPDAKVGLRDAAIIACAYALGLRRAEVIGLNLADIASHDATTIALMVRGKGNKQRVGYLRGAFADLLNEYLVSRGTLLVRFFSVVGLVGASRWATDSVPKRSMPCVICVGAKLVYVILAPTICVGPVFHGCWMREWI